MTDAEHGAVREVARNLTLVAHCECCGDDLASEPGAGERPFCVRAAGEGWRVQDGELVCPDCAGSDEDLHGEEDDEPDSELESGP